MPNELTVKAATLTSTKTFGGTNAQFAEAMRLYCTSLGIPISGTNQQVLDRLVEHIWDDMARVAKEQRQREKNAEDAVANAQEVNTELPF